MINITSFETLDKAIRLADGEPTVLEALWDGDTSGWYLYLKYELIERFNKEHSKIGRLMWALEMVDKAISGDYCFKIYFKNGFTYRDDAVLRFVNFVSDGSTSLAAIVQQYSGILTETEVRDTVIKMEKAGCLTIEGEIVQTTDVTRKLL